MRGRVEQQVDQVVVQQVDLVDVEHAAVRGGQQARARRPSRPRSAPARCRASRPAGPRRRRPAARPAARPGAARAAASSCGPSGHAGSGAAGSQENRQPATTATGGSSAASARTAVDLAVPFSPRTSTPPTAGDDRVEQQREPQVVHPDDGGERIRALLDYLAVVAIEPVLPGFPRPKWRNSTAAGVSGSRSRRRPRGSPPVTVAGQPRIRTGVPPRCYLGTAWHTGRTRCRTVPAYPPGTLARAESLLSSPGAHVASHSAGNSQLTRVA